MIFPSKYQVIFLVTNGTTDYLLKELWFINVIVILYYFKKSTNFPIRMAKSRQYSTCFSFFFFFEQRVFLKKTKTISFDTLLARVLINAAFV